MKYSLLFSLVTLFAPVVSFAADVGCRVFLVSGAFGGRHDGRASAWFLKPEDYFSEYRTFLEAKGCAVKTAEFPEDATVEQRGMILRDQIQRWGNGPSVFIIAHSQGGIDARYALKDLRLEGVAGLFTIGAPHTGTPAADWVISHRTNRSVLYRLLKVFADYDLDALGFAGEMSREFLEKHAKHFEAVPSVRYAAAQGDCRTSCHWALRISACWLGIGPGDGLIPVASQRFGEDLGTYDLDHISEIGTDSTKRPVRQLLLNRIWGWMGLELPNQ